MPRSVVVFAVIFVLALCSEWHVARVSLRRRTPMQRAALWCIGGVRGLWAGAADTDPQHLNQLFHGDYAVTDEATCLVALPPGFNPDLTPRDGRWEHNKNSDRVNVVRSRLC